ncbi:DoxX family protein [Mobilicoccus sp.]|uniref:DoxX family protein n=1 Tax=Mobilicoccus sp. TaxID=2034349 RepID=UPI0037C9552F
MRVSHGAGVPRSQCRGEAGLAKIRQDPRVTDTLVRLGVGTPLQRTIGALEMLGGTGLVVGICLLMLGVAAFVSGLFLEILDMPVLSTALPILGEHFGAELPEL